MFKELQIILKRRLHRIIRLKPFTLFLAVSLINALLFLILMPFLGEHGFNWVVMENNSDFESADYFLCILFSLGSVTDVVPLLYRQCPITYFSVCQCLV